MKKAILINKKAGTGKVMLFKNSHTQSLVLGLADNNTECEVLDGPMQTADRYPGISLYKIKVDGKVAYVNSKWVKVKK